MVIKNVNKQLQQSEKAECGKQSAQEKSGWVQFQHYGEIKVNEFAVECVESGQEYAELTRSECFEESNPDALTTTPRRRITALRQKGVACQACQQNDHS